METVSLEKNEEAGKQRTENTILNVVVLFIRGNEDVLFCRFCCYTQLSTCRGLYYCQ